MINLRSEPIVAVGAIISGIPLVDRVPSDILQLKNEPVSRLISLLLRIES